MAAISSSPKQPDSIWKKHDFIILIDAPFKLDRNKQNSPKPSRHCLNNHQLAVKLLASTRCFLSIFSIYVMIYVEDFQYRNRKLLRTKPKVSTKFSLRRHLVVITTTASEDTFTLASSNSAIHDTITTDYLNVFLTNCQKGHANALLFICCSTDLLARRPHCPVLSSLVCMCVMTRDVKSPKKNKTAVTPFNCLF